MMTVTAKVVCPQCSAINDYDIISNELIDSDLYTTYQCEHCGHIYTNVYALIYMGGYDDTVKYDRDNLIVKR